MLGTDKAELLPPAVQASSAGQQQAAALREALHVEVKAQVMSCMNAENGSTSELTAWGVVGNSLHKGRFIEQDIATLLSGLLGVTIYVIAHTDAIDHLQVTKYVGEALFHM